MVKVTGFDAGKKAVTLGVSLAMSAFSSAFLIAVGFLGACAGAFSCCVARRQIEKAGGAEKAAVEKVASRQGGFRDAFRARAFAGFRWPAVLASVLLGAVYFVSVVWVCGLGIRALALFGLGIVLLAASLVDIEVRIIPNGLVLAAVLIWVASFLLRGFEWGVFSVLAGNISAGLPAPSVSGQSVATMDSPSVAGDALSCWLALLFDSCLGSFGVSGLVLVFSLVVDAFCGRPSLGGGDVKLLFAVGLFLGFALSLLNLLIACGLAILFWLFARAWRVCFTERVRGGVELADGASALVEDDVASRDDGTFPFGPSIALATWFTVVAGQSILVWYCSLA